MKKTFKKIISAASATAFILSMTITAIAPSTSAEAAKAAKFDENGSYKATMGVQTSTNKWITRMAYYEGSQNEMYDTDNFFKMYSADGSEKTFHDGTFDEVELAGNGTYQVTLTDADFAGDTDLSQLHVATNIPLNDQIKFTDVKLNINGTDIVTMEEGVMEDQDAYLQGGMVLLVFNHWRPELVDTLAGLGVPESESAASGGYTMLTGQGGESITITFTVSGFAYDNPDAVVATEAPADDASSVSSSTDSSSDSSSSTSSALPIIIVVAVVIVVIVVVIVMNKKKKN